MSLSSSTKQASGAVFQEEAEDLSKIEKFIQQLKQEKQYTQKQNVRDSQHQWTSSIANAHQQSTQSPSNSTKGLRQSAQKNSERVSHISTGITCDEKNQTDHHLQKEFNISSQGSQSLFIQNAFPTPKGACSGIPLNIQSLLTLGSAKEKKNQLGTHILNSPSAADMPTMRETSILQNQIKSMSAELFRLNETINRLKKEKQNQKVKRVSKVNFDSESQLSDSSSNSSESESEYEQNNKEQKPKSEKECEVDRLIGCYLRCAQSDKFQLNLFRDGFVNEKHLFKLRKDRKYRQLFITTMNILLQTLLPSQVYLVGSTSQLNEQQQQGSINCNSNINNMTEYFKSTTNLVNIENNRNISASESCNIQPKPQTQQKKELSPNLNRQKNQLYIQNSPQKCLPLNISSPSTQITKLYSVTEHQNNYQLPQEQKSSSQQNIFYHPKQIHHSQSNLINQIDTMNGYYQNQHPQEFLQYPQPGKQEQSMLLQQRKQVIQHYQKQQQKQQFDDSTLTNYNNNNNHSSSQYNKTIQTEPSTIISNQHYLSDNYSHRMATEHFGTMPSSIFNDNQNMNTSNSLSQSQWKLNNTLPSYGNDLSSNNCQQNPNNSINKNTNNNNNNMNQINSLSQSSNNKLNNGGISISNSNNNKLQFNSPSKQIDFTRESFGLQIIPSHDSFQNKQRMSHYQQMKYNLHLEDFQEKTNRPSSNNRSNNNIESARFKKAQKDSLQESEKNHIASSTRQGSYLHGSEDSQSLKEAKQYWDQDHIHSKKKSKPQTMNEMGDIDSVSVSSQARSILTPEDQQHRKSLISKPKVPLALEPCSHIQCMKDPFNCVHSKSLKERSSHFFKCKERDRQKIIPDISQVQKRAKAPSNNQKPAFDIITNQQ